VTTFSFVGSDFVNFEMSSNSFIHFGAKNKTARFAALNRL
jgi:hypothetical protein